MGTYYLQLSSRGRETFGWMESYGVELNPEGLAVDTCFQTLLERTPGIGLLGHAMAPETLEAVVEGSSKEVLEGFVEQFRTEVSLKLGRNLWKKRVVTWEVKGNAELTALMDHLGLNAAATAS